MQKALKFLNPENYNSRRDFIFGATDSIAICIVIFSVFFAFGDGYFVYALSACVWAAIISTLSLYFTLQQENKEVERKLALNDPEFFAFEKQNILNFLNDLQIDNAVKEDAVAELYSEKENKEISTLVFPIPSSLTYLLGFIFSFLFASLIFFYSKNIIVFIICTSAFLFLLNFIKGKFTGINNYFSAIGSVLVTTPAAIILYFLFKSFQV